MQYVRWFVMITNDVGIAAYLARTARDLLVDFRETWRGVDRRLLGHRADALANNLLLGLLQAYRPGDAVLSEEEGDDRRRVGSSRVWIIDPLDGTREFVRERSNEWAVHVALWELRKGLTVGAIAQPGLDVVHSNCRLVSSQVTRSKEPLRVVVSRAHPPPFMDSLAAIVQLKVVRMGSVGAKVMSILRNEADAFVHSTGHWEWDLAAPVCVALANGLHASRITGAPLLFNQSKPIVPDVLICRTSEAEQMISQLSRIRCCQK
jgi:3'(2'), 5'-bisphosphate nucleotidase